MYNVTKNYIRDNLDNDFYVSSFLNDPATISWLESQPGFISHSFALSEDSLVLTRNYEFETEDDYTAMQIAWNELHPTYLEDFVNYNNANGHLESQ